MRLPLTLLPFLRRVFQCEKKPFLLGKGLFVSSRTLTLVQDRNDAERHEHSKSCGFERLVSEPSSRAAIGREHEIPATCEHTRGLSGTPTPHSHSPCCPHSAPTAAWSLSDSELDFGGTADIESRHFAVNKIMMVKHQLSTSDNINRRNH